MTATTATAQPASSRAEINRRNAQRSTGPRTASGKERVKFNALKHGLRARTPILPGEDEGAYRARLDAWMADLGPRDEVDRFLVARAVQASWQLDRVERARAARREAARFADAERTAAQAEEVAALGRRLFWLPAGPTALYPHPAPAGGEIERVSYSADPEDPDDPARLVVRLEAMALGCAWLLDRWGELREILEAGLLWQPPDRLKAIRMLGRQPLEAADDRRVMAIYLSCWAMDPEDQHGFTDLITELAPKERQAYLERLNGRDPMAAMPESPEAARAELLALIAGEEERLEQALTLHLEREQARAEMELAFDDSAWGERLRKYELSNDKTLLRIVETLRRRHREADQAGPPGPIASIPAGFEPPGAIDPPSAASAPPPAGFGPPEAIVHPMAETAPEPAETVPEPAETAPEPAGPAPPEAAEDDAPAVDPTEAEVRARAIRIARAAGLLPEAPVEVATEADRSEGRQAAGRPTGPDPTARPSELALFADRPERGGAGSWESPSPGPAAGAGFVR